MTLIRPAALFALAALLVAGCGSDDNTGPGGGAGMAATIGGQSWNASFLVQGSRASNILQLTGSDNVHQIFISIPGVTSTGTFTLGQGNQGLAQVIHIQGGMATWVSSLVGGTGTVTVSTFTETGASGTFSFSGIAAASTPATGTRPVTNGTFNVTF